ncbi:bcl-2-like protein 11 isoform X7 [Polypterus senegalus]|uniref:bcl-2-like protein 11 isoform X7 n=1 Tax=Polypterus senegalus TaxID=55291 RepID=UPI001966C5A8|nr:bcl-2-like protein 11 isoform X7 [Polypterus senegalus]
MARPPSDLNSESGAGDGGPLQPTQGAGRPLSRPGPRTHSEDMPQASSGPTRARRSSMPEEMRPEEMVAQELRRIGDDFNYLYFQRVARAYPGSVWRRAGASCGQGWASVAGTMKQKPVVFVGLLCLCGDFLIF